MMKMLENFMKNLSIKLKYQKELLEIGLKVISN